MNILGNPPFFSLIVPVYKVEPFIHQCVDSILEQTFEDFEIILIDDGSPDNCPKICEDYKDKDSRIVVLHKENGGLSDARNYGINIARGDYIIFIDSDDFLVNNHCLFDLYGFISKNFYSLYLLNRTISEISDLNISYKNAFCKKEKFLRNIIKNKYPRLCAWAWVCKRNIFFDNDLYFKKGILHEDEQWMPRLLLCLQKNSEIGIFNGFFYFYRLNREGAITSQIKTKNIIDKLDIADELMNRGKDLRGLEKKFCYTRASQIMMSIYVIAKEKLKEDKDLKTAAYTRIKYLNKSLRISHRIYYIFTKLRFIYDI